MLPYDKFLSSMHCFWPTSSCRTPHPPARPSAKHKKNAMPVTLSSVGVLASAFLSSLQILRPLIQFCYVACSINCDIKSLYYSKLQTVTSSLSVYVLQSGLCTQLIYLGNKYTSIFYFLIRWVVSTTSITRIHTHQVTVFKYEYF